MQGHSASIRHSSRLRLLVAVAALVPVAGLAAQARSDLVEIRDLRELEHAFIRLSDQIRPSTVAVRTYVVGTFVDSRSGRQREGTIRHPRSYGSGALLDRDGLIVTNTHVIEGADEIVVTLHDGREVEAELVQADQRSDLAVVRIDARNLRPVRLGHHASVQVGQWCFVVGNPFGLAGGGEPSVTYGIVSALGRDLSDELNISIRTAADERYYGELIQTSAAINPGNSGGPLFNIDGEMIGVVAAIESRTGVTEGTGFAIPMTLRTRQIIEQLSRGERVEYGYLGVQVRDLRRSARRGEGYDRARGVVLLRLDPPDGPASEAGLQPGDVITQFNGVRIRNTNHLVRVVQASPVGKTVPVSYERDGAREVAHVTLTTRPVSQVLVGGQEDEPRTSFWRGAWLAEPTDELLREFGESRDRVGIVVMEVRPGSLAERAGLEAQQMVLRVGRNRVRTLDEFLTAVGRAGERPELEVWDEGATRVVRLPSQD